MSKAQLTLTTVGRFTSQMPPNLPPLEAIDWHRRRGEDISSLIFRTRDGAYFPSEVKRATTRAA